ncbi:MFS transporter [Microbacterium sp. ARD32]|uniref:MFS transporter n=1 Tax=Microbacterium sp. ARD32 TaxID=2962577 RepID=UPI0028814A3E|nr:MFS transporter [Microbacterium sp. ARD32]MDT0157692.1 MFS transporter [Microbacterium sp. ARD32]
MTRSSRLWSNSRYVVWLISDTAKELAGGLATFALPLLALAVTGEPTQAGVIGAIGTAVLLATSLYGGVLADRHDRARLMVLGASISVALAAGFTALVVTDALSFAVLLGIEIVLCAQFGLFGMAGESILKDIVAPGALGRAQAANQARDAILRLGATPLGGVLLAMGGWLIGVGMLVSSLVEAASAMLLGRMQKADATASGTPEAQASGADGATDDPTVARPNALAELRAGVTWLMRRRDLRPILFVMTLINLGFSTATTAIIYTLQQRGESPAVIGLLGSAIGAATLLGALIATPLVTRVRSGVISVCSLSLATVAVGILPFTDAVPVMIAAPAIALVLTPALNAGLLGYAMVAIPTELVGRVRSAMTVIVSGAMPLAPLIAGVGLSRLGAPATFAIAAGCCVATVMLAFGTPALRALPVEADWADHATRFEEREPAVVNGSGSGA